MTLNPFDLSGEAFLLFYGVVFAVAAAAGIAIPGLVRPDGRDRPVADADRLALLAGGRARFVDAVVSRLLADGALALIGRGEFHPRRRDAGRDPAERGVLALAAPATWKRVEEAVGPYADAVERRLVSAGLLMEASDVLRMRLGQTAPYLLPLALGLVRWELGRVRERPVEHLGAALIATVVAAAIRWAAVDRRTRAGRAALGRARAGTERLRRAPTTDETALAVALYGTVVLAGSPLAHYHQLRGAGGDGGGASDTGSDDGAGGCGGGGCGGCGG